METHRGMLVALAVVLAVLFVVLYLPGASLADKSPGAMAAAFAPSTGGTTVTTKFASPTLGRDLDYVVYLPAGYGTSNTRYPTIYLLHGRGSSMTSWLTMKTVWDDMIATGRIPPTIFVMPDASQNGGGGYFVDSAFTGNGTVPAGEQFETAFTGDLIAHIDATYRTVDDRNARAVGGYSMGGYGAMRYGLAHPDLFRVAIVLSPAVYYPLPPLDSSTREFGAFGNGSSLFDPQIYIQKNYTSTFPTFSAANVPLGMFIAVGDDEGANLDPVDWVHGLDYEAHTLYMHARHVTNLSAELRVMNGGHGWDVWRPGFMEGVQYAFRFMSAPTTRLFIPIVMKSITDIPPTPTPTPTTEAPSAPILNTVVGAAGEDRSAGVATDKDGNIFHAVAIYGAYEGQAYGGASDILVTKYAASGERLWVRQFGATATDVPWAVATDAAGNVVVAGYTKGDLDGAHAGNTSDDIFVAKLGPDGAPVWTKQVGTSAADRAYGVATDSAGNVYAGGYTKGNLSGANAGDKDVALVKFSASGVQEWVAQFGAAGEEKAWAVATDVDGNAYLVGPSGSDLAGQIGGYDIFVARYSPAGTQTLLKQFGTDQDDDATGIAVAADGSIFVTGGTAGAFLGASPLGDNDAFVARLTTTGATSKVVQFGTTANEKGATLALDAAGNVYVTAFSAGDLAGTGAIGKFDALLLKYSADLTRQWARQFGTPEDEGAHSSAEPNLYLATFGSNIYVSGKTGGNFYGYINLGSSDVFLTTFRADGSGGPATVAAPVKAVLGTAGEDLAAGVAVDRNGNIYQAISAAGAVDGQPYLASSDIAVLKYSRGGQKLWTRQFGTSAADVPWAAAVDKQDNVFVAGYTKGDLDGAHAGNTSDDMFVAKIAPDGTRVWTKQLGLMGVADRAYAVATDAAGNVYIGGYTKGNLSGTNAGDKDNVIAKFSAAGVQEWVKQFGSAGEDKVYGLGADGAGNICAAGLTGDDLAGSQGGYDAWVACYDGAGAQTLLKQFGTAVDDEAWALAVAPDGRLFVSGGTKGAMTGMNAGESDIFLAQVSATGVVSPTFQIGTAADEKGAGVALDAAGNVYVAGFTSGNLAGAGAVGKFDTALIKLNPAFTQQWIRQFGTTADDGAYEWAEPNLYIAAYSNSIYLQGLTGGNFYGAANLGSTDVFLTEFRSDGSGGPY